MPLRKKSWIIIGASIATLLAVGGAAYAYTVNNNLASYASLIKNQDGTYSLSGGDDVQVLQSPWSALTGHSVKIGLENYTVNGQSYGVMLADMQGVDANNGYLLIAAPPEFGGTSSNVKDVVAQLGGNYDFVISYLENNNQLIKTHDVQTGTDYYYVPFASVVTESGAKFGPKSVQPAG